MQSLKDSGYQTITQQDVINYYKSGASLPEKALLLIFEDGILNTTRLAQPTLWKEIGSNGYRLSYINVFDRFKNYFGHLNTHEFLDIHSFLRRDYNHYLMDFLRDENYCAPKAWRKWKNASCGLRKDGGNL